MKKLYQLINRTIEDLKSLRPHLYKITCIHHSNRIYDEEYHVFPPFLTFENWLTSCAKYNRDMDDLLKLGSRDYEYFEEYMSHCPDSYDLFLARINLLRMNVEILKKCTAETFHMEKLEECFKKRESMHLDFGMLELEEDQSPTERLNRIMRFEDPIQGIIFVQNVFIDTILYFLYTESVTYASYYMNQSDDEITIYDFFKTKVLADMVIKMIDDLAVKFDIFLEEYKRE